MSGTSIPGASTGTGQLRVTRNAEKWRDKWRTYKILVDGIAIGKVGRDRSTAVTVSEGPHRVRLAINWCTSPELPVEIKAGTVVQLDCGPARSDLGTARQMREAPETYLWLRPAGERG